MLVYNYYMQDYLRGLNPKQLEAVQTPARHVRVIAGAGSGKTRVLTTRIAYVIDQWGVDPERILAITFTNKAANEMRIRIEKLLDGQALGSHISTIHSFCVTLLRQDIRREGYPSNFTILDQDDQKSIIKEAMKQYGITARDYPIAQTLDYIANCKCAGFTPEKALETARSAHYEMISRMYGFYEDRCRQLYGLDFDDLLLWSNRILKKYPKVREKWQKHFDFILVDEFQDIDDVQNELINLLTSENSYIYVVGDPDQTIYTWRGANINIIMGFDKTYPDAQTIILEQNYRSTGMILGGANSLIQYNRNRVKKDLFTDNESGSKIVHFTAASDDEEAGYVLSRMDKLFKAGESYRSVAVLYRSAYLSRPIEKKLMDFKIPYVIYGGVRFYERAEIKDMLSYLRMLTVSDDLSFKRIVNNPKRSLGDKSIDTLFEQARRDGETLYEASEHFDGSPKTALRLREFHDLIADWKVRSLNMGLEEIFQMVYEESGYRKMLEDSEDPKDEERLENVKELLNDIVSYQNSRDELTLADYLDNVALYSDIQDNNDGQYVSLMTIHAAKGLEFDTVFVIGLSEGVFPSQRTVEESGLTGLEEERRLAYVACTRAKRRLFLSDNCGYSYATAGSKQTSRFVSEIDDRYLTQAGVDNRSEARETADFYSDSHKSAGTARVRYRPGDIVVHEVFGEGVVISVDAAANTGVFAFQYPYMNRTLKLDFPRMHKKENLPS